MNGSRAAALLHRIDNQAFIETTSFRIFVRSPAVYDKSVPTVSRKVTQSVDASVNVEDGQGGSALNARSENSFVQAGKNVLWKICSNIRSSINSDGVLLLDMEDHFYYSLDRLGAQIWITIESSPSGITFEDILDALETHFGVPRNQLARDLRVRLQRLHSLGFIQTHCEN